jgi:hypothetical protein
MCRRNAERDNRRVGLKLAGVAVGMFVFAYALVPLYDVICDVTGLNGKTGRAEATVGDKVDQERWVTVEFTGNSMSGLPWEFRSLQKSMRVHPGEVAVAYYEARNSRRGHHRSGGAERCTEQGGSALQEDRVFLFQPATAQGRRIQENAGTFCGQQGSAERSQHGDPVVRIL